MDIFNNILTLTDSYKPTHWPQYPKGTETVVSYLESRGGVFDNTLFFGLQYILKTYLQGQVVTDEKIKIAKKLWDAHLGPGHFNEDGWRYILEKYNGHLPVSIKAVPEGTEVKTGNVLMQIYNTDKKVPWLTNHLESILLQVWYPTTVATLSREIKKNIISYLKITTDYTNKEIDPIVNFMLHDFGFRGVSSVESAAIGAAGHLVNFRGTDTATSILMIQDVYNTDEMVAFSVPASEHSTITSWGEENEVKAFENMLDVYPVGIRACVSDSYNILRACEEYWGTKLKDKILNLNGRLVIRPDSGDPVQTLKRIFNILWDKIGGRVNSKGFKVLDDHVRVLQGDGINFDSIKDIMDMMVEEKFSIENIVFGMGGALLQKVDRDTQKFAFKCCSITIDGTEKDVQKSPIEIDKYGNIVESFKKSKKGYLKLVKEDGEFKTIQDSTSDENDEMIKVFENGVLLKDYTFGEIRERDDIYNKVKPIKIMKHQFTDADFRN